MRADLERAHIAEKARVQDELDEVRRHLANLQGSFELRRAELEAAQSALERLSGGLPEGRLDAAYRALGQGETEAADALFAQIEDMASATIARAATAAFERGKLAEADIRWADSARALRDRGAASAKLQPCPPKPENTPGEPAITRDALRLGEELIGVAVAEHGDGGTEHAAALDGHAMTLRTRAASRRPSRSTARRWRSTRRRWGKSASPTSAIGRQQPRGLLPGEHGPLRGGRAALPRGAGDPREALGQGASRLSRRPQQPRAAATGPRGASRRPSRSTARRWRSTEALGQAHPDSRDEPQQPRGAATRPRAATGGRAALPRGAGDRREDARARGIPTYASDLNNLAGLLEARADTRRPSRCTARRWRSGEKALGHGASRLSRTSLNNLAGLLAGHGPLAEAEPLYREALAIVTAKLGERAPEHEDRRRQSCGALAPAASVRPD